MALFAKNFGPQAAAPKARGRRLLRRLSRRRSAWRGQPRRPAWADGDSGLAVARLGLHQQLHVAQPELAGIRAALAGSVITILITAAFTVPVGVGAAIYLEEYAPKNRLTQLIEVNISNLAGVPSVVYGLLGLGVFVQLMSLGKVVLAGALTLTLLVLPIVILASREAIRAVPNEYRLGAFALGADRWQVIKGAVLPSTISRHTHGDDTRALARDRRGGADSGDKRACVRDVRAGASGQIHSLAAADIHVGRQAARGIPLAGGGGNHRSAHRSADDERRRGVSAKQVSDKVGGLGRERFGSNLRSLRTEPVL